jgi:hypothetical protein
VFELKPDFERVLDRFEAWWDGQILDRPLASITFSRPKVDCVPVPRKKPWKDLRERWLDTEHVVASAEANLRNRVYFADALPVAWPNLGPEVFSAFYGCKMIYGERTSWSSPVLEDWTAESLAALQLDEDNFYFQKILELTDALIVAGRGKFIVGYTDLHGGGDAIAAFRDPQNLLIDTIESPEAIKGLVERIGHDFLRVYDLYHERLTAAGMPSTTWMPATGKGKFHVPSNDFSCMISQESFEDLFIPGIVQECRHMDRCIYHLDGPGALRYLDLLLSIPEIHAIQWVPGAGQDYWGNWIDVYRQIQQAGKSMPIYVPVRDLPRVFDVLRPEGVWLCVSGITDEQEADAAIKAITRWSM